MAVFLNSHQDDLADALRLNVTTPGIAAHLADKGRLGELAASCGVRMPRSSSPSSKDDLQHVATTVRFPVVVKYSEPFTRLSASGASGPTVMDDPADLIAWGARVGYPLPPVQVQEYVPPEHSQVWIYNGLRTPDGYVLSFTGRTVRSWPPRRGAATFAVSKWNAQVAGLGERLMSTLGYVGPCDLDFVHDDRDGSYLLLDFNPRYGASAAMFRQDSGVDLIRANHLATSGRPIPSGTQIDGRTLRVEPMDLRARRVFPAERITPTETVTAFWRADDPRPAVVEWSRFIAGGARSAWSGRAGRQ
jgi:predicted ATP-grasp superfamily ATP-dependent carboligase